MGRVFTVDQAAEYLQVSPYTVREWLRKGKITGRKIGRVYRILEAELNAILQGARPEEVASRRMRTGQPLASPHTGSTTDDFVREKHEETIREERRWKMRAWNAMSREERLKLINEVKAEFADAHFSSDDIVRERQEEVEREER